VSILRRVLGTEESRVLGGLGLIPQSFDRAPVFGTSRVNEKTTLGLAAAWSCITLLSDVASTLPLDGFTRSNGTRLPYRPGGEKPVWMITPYATEPNVGVQSLISEIVVSMYLAGEAFVYAPKDPETLQPLEVRVLDPNAVKIVRRGRDVVYVVRTGQDVKATELGPDVVLHIPLIRFPGEDHGINPIEALRRTIGLGITLEESASSFFANASTPSGVIETSEPLTPEQIKSLKEGWIRHHTGGNAHAPGILSGGATFKALSFRPEDAQLLASREYGVAEIARVFRVPPALLAMTTPGSMSFASVSELNAMFVAYTLRPLVEKIERGLSTLVPLPNGFVKLSMDALVRGNLLDRYNAHRIAIQEGWESIADVRRTEDLPPIDDVSAAAYRQPLNQADSVLAAARQKADIYAALVGAGMDSAEAKKIAKL